jgi:hypothetical protein
MAGIGEVPAGTVVVDVMAPIAVDRVRAEEEDEPRAEEVCAEEDMADGQAERRRPTLGFRVSAAAGGGGSFCSDTKFDFRVTWGKASTYVIYIKDQQLRLQYTTGLIYYSYTDTDRFLTDTASSSLFFEETPA